MIFKRGYINVQYPTLDLFEGARQERKTRKVIIPPAVGTYPNPPPAVVPSKEQPGITEKKAAPVSYPTADVPSRSGSGGATHDEVVSCFIASCPRGSLMSMAKLPTKILAAKGASVLAEGFKLALAMEKQLLTLKEAYIGLQARLEDT
ncbi:hypothetical protein LWI28_005830 [Acer negundo]|uniref:Uncharacterized protein n=1 Tax=Acer negundo TaxID=4023 RepID=A0AAD5NX62_ACENE|nr:hypothetical protein LWI28_005830 [Acer negundo]